MTHAVGGFAGKNSGETFREDDCTSKKINNHFEWRRMEALQCVVFVGRPPH